MIKLYHLVLLPAAILFLVFYPPVLKAQQQNQQYSAEELAKIKEQVGQLVAMFEFSINTLGDEMTTPKEKEVIINESYSKIFVDEEVQIEDDLDEKRTNLINKDVQAYLKDITFFYKKVKFTYTIENIEHDYTESGKLYFLVSANRNLNGINLSSKAVNNNKSRFIEVNYNDQEQDVRIASVYTTKLNENEENRNWWNNLTQAWKDVFGSDYLLGDTLSMNEVYAFADNWIITRTDTFEIIKYDTILVFDQDTLFIDETDTVPASIKDTIPYNAEIIYENLMEISNIRELNIENNEKIYELDPLRLFSKLRSLNCSGTKIRDLTPIRNLGKLQKLECSNTLVKDISPLKYSINLRTIIIDDNEIRSIRPVRNFSELEILHFNNTLVDSLQPLAGLDSLKDLRFTGTSVYDLSPLAGLKNLQLLNCSRTNVVNINDLSTVTKLERLYAEDNKIQDLTPLSGLEHLRTLYLDNTLVRDLTPLTGLASLKKIYCDNSMVTAEAAKAFTDNNPGVLVIFESAALINWWNGLNTDWQLVFSSYVSVDPEPTKEQLSQLSTLTEIDISHNGRIDNLEPLKELRMLEQLDMSFTPVSSINPLADLVDLAYLNAKGSGIQDLYPLRDLIKLEFLDASVTKVENLDALSDLNNLKVLRLDSTNIQSIVSLQGLKSIQTIYCDNTSISLSDAVDFNIARPECLIIFQTNELKAWWKKLPAAWQDVFHQVLEFDDPPTKADLHRIASVDKLDLDGNKSIKSLSAINKFLFLRTLQVSNTQISDLGPVSNLKKLEALEIADNPIVDLSPISNLENLTRLDMRNTPVEDLDPIEYMTSLEDLNISGTPVKNLKLLSNLKNLRRLSFYNTRINKLKHIYHLKNLEYLECYNTRLSDKDLEEFRSLHPRCEIIFY